MNQPIEHLFQIPTYTDSLYDCGFQPGHPNDPSIEFAAFSGGGVAGIAYAGTISELENHGIRENIKYWLGSSVGSVISAFSAMNVSAQFINQEIRNFNPKIFLDFGGKEMNGKSWWNTIMKYRYAIPELVSKLGTVRGSHFKNWLINEMNQAGYSEDLTFAKLYDLTGNHLVITTTSVNTFESLKLSRSSYPYMKIVDAIHASIIIPFLVQPILMADPLTPQGKRMLVDGGVLDNLPLNSCDVISPSGELLGFNRKAVGFTLVSHGKWVPDYVEIDGLLKYSMTFAMCLHNKIHEMQSHQPYFWDRVIPIETYDIGTFSFDAGLDALDKIIESGKNATRDFLDQRDTMLKKNGPLPNNLFIPSHRLRHSGIEYLSNDLIEDTDVYRTNPSRYQ